jgi:hypothetical protein
MNIIYIIIYKYNIYIIIYKYNIYIIKYKYNIYNNIWIIYI